MTSVCVWADCANMSDMCEVRVTVMAVEEHLGIENSSRATRRMCLMDGIANKWTRPKLESFQQWVGMNVEQGGRGVECYRFALNKPPSSPDVVV